MNSHKNKFHNQLCLYPHVIKIATLLMINQRFSKHSNISRLIGILVSFFSFTYSVGCLHFVKYRAGKFSLLFFFYFLSDRYASCRAFYRKNGESILVSFSFSSFTYSVGCLYFIKKISRRLV